MFASALLATLATGPGWARDWLAACATVPWCQDPYHPNGHPLQAKGTQSLRTTVGSSEEQPVFTCGVSTLQAGKGKLPKWTDGSKN